MRQSARQLHDQFKAANGSTCCRVISRSLCHDRLRFESLLLDIPMRFVNLPAQEVDSQIEIAQEAICRTLNIDLSAMWQWSDETPHFLTITHLHSPPEGPALPESIDARQANETSRHSVC